MAIEIVDFPMKNGGSFHSYVSLPEGRSMILMISLLKASSISGFQVTPDFESSHV